MTDPYFSVETFLPFDGNPGTSLANRALAQMLGISSTGTVTDLSGHIKIANTIQHVELDRVNKLPNPTPGAGPGAVAGMAATAPIGTDLLTIVIDANDIASSTEYPDLVPPLLRNAWHWQQFAIMVERVADANPSLTDSNGAPLTAALLAPGQTVISSRSTWAFLFSSYLREEYMGRATQAIDAKQETNESTAAKAKTNCIGGMSEECQGIVRTNQAMCLNDLQMKPSYACAGSNGKVLCDKNFFISATKQLEDLESRIANLKCQERWLQILYAELYRALQMCLANYKRAQLKCQTDKTESCKPKPSAEACAGLKRKQTTKVTVTKKGKTQSVERNPDSLGYFSLFGR